jgi:hypothetical protein
MKQKLKNIDLKYSTISLSSFSWVGEYKQESVYKYDDRHVIFNTSDYCISARRKY